MISEISIRIMFMSGPEDGKELTITRPVKNDFTDDFLYLYKVTIGRRDEYDIVIPFDALISRLHASILILQDTMILVDENSRNGTFINRKLLQSTSEELPVRTLFRVGKTWIRVQSIERRTG